MLGYEMFHEDDPNFVADRRRCQKKKRPHGTTEARRSDISTPQPLNPFDVPPEQMSLLNKERHKQSEK